MTQRSNKILVLFTASLAFCILTVTLIGIPSYSSVRSFLPWERKRWDINPYQATHLSQNLPNTSQIHSPGRWRPEDHRRHNEYLQHVITHVDSSPPQVLTPALKEFRALIESTPRLYMYFTQMFREISWGSPYWRELYGSPQIRDYDQFLQVLNYIVRRAPAVDFDFPPMASIFARPMATMSGHAALLDPGVNSMLKRVLNEWGMFLQTPASRYALGLEDEYWLGEKTKTALEQVANSPYNTSAKFEDIYECDTSQRYLGFSSWDDFFTRKFREGTRPLAGPDDDNIIVNACEAMTYNIQTGVNLRDKFFLKGEPYSVLDMLGHDPLAAHFEGGTVYHAFLTLLSYHRWHAAVSGTIRRAFVIDGTYFSGHLYQDMIHPNATDIISVELGSSQAYLTALATRAIIIIEADNPSIGLVAFVAVGMEEVSSCEITVTEGQHIKKGEQLGMFHFGGSSYCLLFQNGVKLEEFPISSNVSSTNVPIRSKLAILKSPTIVRQW